MTGNMVVGLVLTVALAGCGGAARGPAGAGGGVQAAPTAPALGRRPAYTAADVEFMSNKIHHHAQAVRMAGWAATHGASDAVRRLSERIVVGQQDEIAIMEHWLRERGETLSGTDASHDTMPDMSHSGTAHSTPMPGMLTAEQLAELDRARGAEFDRLFLTRMITHHQGALTMVDRLFGAAGAAQDETVFRLASDIHAEQSAEIARMRKMLTPSTP
jgi:uncharacterized protein (DUF305 family)